MSMHTNCKIASLLMAVVLTGGCTITRVHDHNDRISWERKQAAQKEALAKQAYLDSKSANAIRIELLYPTARQSGLPNASQAAGNAAWNDYFWKHPDIIVLNKSQGDERRATVGAKIKKNGANGYRIYARSVYYGGKTSTVIQSTVTASDSDATTAAKTADHYRQAAASAVRALLKRHRKE